MVSTNTETTNNGEKPPATEERSLENVPMSKIELADIPTYEAWIKTKLGDLPERVAAAAKCVVDNTALVEIAELGRELKGEMKTIEKTINEKIVEEYYKRWKTATQFRKKVLDPLARIVKDAERSIGTFNEEVKRKRRAEAEAREAEIRRRQEDAARVEAERQAKERRVKEEHERKVLEQKLAHTHEEAIRHDVWWTGERARLDEIEREKQERIKREEDARLEHAAAATKEGEKEKADVIMDTQTALEPAPAAPAPVPKPEPVPAPAPIQAPEPIPEPEPQAPVPLPEIATPDVEKTEGTIYTLRWHALIENPIEMMKYIIASGMDPNFLKQSIELKEQPFLFNMPYLNRMAKKLKTKLTIPGVRAVGERDTHLRS